MELSIYSVDSDDEKYMPLRISQYDEDKSRLRNNI
jgi:hypothetical protein